MLLPVTAKVNENNHLEIGGCDLIELKEKYGTPLYIVDIATVKNQCRKYQESFKFNGLETEIIYASKAFSCTAMCQLIRDEGLSIDVSTGGELFIALNSGFPPEKIYFHGNNKSIDEIRQGIENKVGVFIVDNLSELEMLDKLCAENKIIQNIMLRITPGVKASTHEYIQTGKIKSKFGFGIYNNIAGDAVKKALNCRNLNLIGLHAHIGSQIFNLSCYEKLIEVMLKFIKETEDETGRKITNLNIGGGLGIKYMPEDRPSGIQDLSQIAHDSIIKYGKKYGVNIKKVYLEPGRSVIGNAGVTLYEVGSVKEIADIKNYISIDGGMSDNIRTILYQAKYHACLANRMKDIENSSESELKQYTIVGKHCESGDVIIEEIKLPDVKSGDFISVATTGAYCYSMSSNYNGQPRSAVAAVEDGKSWIWVERQTYKDLVSGDRNLYE